MQTLATYQNWDFTTIWDYTTYPSYPFLRPFTPCPSFPYPFILNSTSAFSYNKFTQTYQLNSGYLFFILTKFFYIFIII